MFTPLSLGKNLPAISIEANFFNLGWQELLIAYPITILHHFTQETSHVHHTTKFSWMKCSHWSRLLRNLKKQGMLDCHTLLIFSPSFLPVWNLNLMGRILAATLWPQADKQCLKEVKQDPKLHYFISALNCLSLVPSLQDRGEKSTSLWCHIYYKPLFLATKLKLWLIISFSLTFIVFKNFYWVNTLTFLPHVTKLG